MNYRERLRRLWSLDGRTELDDLPRQTRIPHRDKIPAPEEEYAQHPDESKSASIDRHLSVAPVHGNPTLDPATTIWDISRMAGYGDGGVDGTRLGEIDATEELSAPGEPLKHDDDMVESSKKWDDDWCSELRGDY